MTYVELLPAVEATPDNPAWHELRRAGVTASEIAAVLDTSPQRAATADRHRNGWRSATRHWRAGR